MEKIGRRMCHDCWTRSWPAVERRPSSRSARDAWRVCLLPFSTNCTSSDTDSSPGCPYASETCILPGDFVRRLIVSSHLWNHYAATVVRQRLRLTTVPTVRGRRYQGHSKMNFVSLVRHGISAF